MDGYPIACYGWLSTPAMDGYPHLLWMVILLPAMDGYPHLLLWMVIHACYGWLSYFQKAFSRYYVCLNRIALNRF
jgi:hypothetical protein